MVSNVQTWLNTAQAKVRLKSSAKYQRTKDKLQIKQLEKEVRRSTSA